jgi:hypothetical protein
VIKLLGLLVGGVAAAICGLVLLVLSVIAAMPWLGVGVAGGPPSVVHIALPAVLPAPAVAPVQIDAGMVSDVERFLLARAAGFSPLDAITATAISIAEDGSGNPTAMSGRNDNGTFDFCLWQVNSSWWPRFGGQAALADPHTCAHAAFVIYGIQGWCAWSTFEASCGKGHTSAYAAFLGRARTAASQGGSQ